MVTLITRSEPAASEWRDLPFGVRLKLRPLSGVLGLAIEAQVAEELDAFRRGEAVLERHGFAETDFGLLADPKIAIGFALFLRASIRAAALIEDWNLTDEAGAALPITPEIIAALFNEGPVPGSGQVLISSFTRIVDEPLQRRAAEGNVSGPSPNGFSAEGPNTAGAADLSARPAPQAAG